MTDAPLPVLEAHAEFANACEAWLSTLPKPGLDAPSLPSRQSTEVMVCKAAMDPVKFFDGYDGQVVVILLFVLLTSILIGWFKRELRSGLSHLIDLAWRRQPGEQGMVIFFGSLLVVAFVCMAIGAVTGNVMIVLLGMAVLPSGLIALIWSAGRERR